MAKIALRAYHREVEGLIESNQSEEALAHCRYILQSFPKYLDTYRLMGKVFLENQRYGEASDVFQRVLSSVPEDFVSHVGMSIIREDEGNMDAAIWHMERAFDVQPYNSAIQGELRRLYGRRDGLEPSKVRLTRGALARMYIKGGLYQQAVAELRAALAEDPQRPDLQVLLANAYFQAGQRVEAVEACSALLKKLPYCFEANRILACILPDTDRAGDAEAYRQRVISLEPYYINLKVATPSADNVPDQAVVIDRLVWQVGQTAQSIDDSQPTWARNLGVSFQDKEALPEWLTEGGEEESASDTSFSAESTAPFTWEETPEEGGESVEMSGEEIPDWMREAGWAPSTGEFQEGPVDYDAPIEIEDEAPPASGEAVAGEMPDWLREMAPQEILEQAEQPPDDLPERNESIPWLTESQAGPGDTEANWLDGLSQEAPAAGASSAAGGEVPDWLQGLAPSEPQTPSPAPIEAGEVPDWLQDLAPEQGPGSAPPAALEATDEIPAWMQAATPAEEELEATASATVMGFEEPAVQPGEASLEEVPDWLQEVGNKEQATLEAAQPASELPDWLKEMQPEATVQPESTPASTEEDSAALAWLEGIQNIPAEQTPESVQEVFPQAAATEESPAASGEEAAIDWLQELEAPGTETNGDTVAATEELPDWLSNLESGEPAEAIPATPPESLPESLDWLEEAGAEGPAEAASEMSTADVPDLSDELAAMAWLENLAAKQGISEDELFTSPEERSEVAPAWVERDAAQEAQSESPAKAEEELPGWLAATEQETLQVQASAAGQDTASGAEALPEWLLEAEAEPQAEAAPADGFPDWLLEAQKEVSPEAVETAEVPAPTGEEPEWLVNTPPDGEGVSGVTGFLEALSPPGTVPEGGEVLDLSDESAAMAWLESLAAKQGVSEEELFTSPEERAETPPAWVQAEATQASLRPPAAESAPEPSGEGLPDWLQEAATEAEFPTETIEATAQEPIQVPEASVPVASGEEMPDWLSAAEAPEAALEASTGEERPDWLSAIEAEADAFEASQVVPAEPPETPEMASTPAAAVDAVSDESMEALIAAISMDDLLGLDETPATEAAPPEPPAAQVTTAVDEVEEETPLAAAPVEATAPAGTQPPPAEAAAPETPAVEAAQPDLNDEAAAMAWLEGLAARQGVSEEELFTKPEERIETPPAWVEKDAAQATEAKAAVEEQALRETPANRAEMQAEPVEETVPEATPETATDETPSEAGEEMPAWLASIPEEIEEESVLATPPAAEHQEPVITQALPTWLQSIEEEDETKTGEEGFAAWPQDVPPPPPVELAESTLQAAPEAVEATWMDAEFPSPEGQISEEDVEEAPETGLDVNTASLVELEALPGIGFILAQNIINYRETYGPFSSLDDLQKVSGVGPATLEEMRQWLRVVPLRTAGWSQAMATPIGGALEEARVLLSQNDPGRAAQIYGQLLRSGYPTAEILSDLQNALYRYPVDIALWQVLGEAYLLNDQLQEALEAYTKAEELLR
ncbi:MAG: helix-hairpin-helix domain-containing protein [Chloroflexota bacterium]